jgi:hypothetical protein
MKHSVVAFCPMWKASINGPFPNACPYCGLDVSYYRDGGLIQRQKWGEHSDLLIGRNIQIYNKQFNCSFDYNGDAKFEDLMRFTITYGDRVTVPSARGNHQNPAIICYIPEVIGSGTGLFMSGDVPSSGTCLISPHSYQWSHAFPVLDQWVSTQFLGQTSNCRFCGRVTSVGQPVCSDCYRSTGSWLNLI